jgi:hypothetical protein
MREITKSPGLTFSLCAIFQAVAALAYVNPYLNSNAVSSSVATGYSCHLGSLTARPFTTSNSVTCLQECLPVSSLLLSAKYRAQAMVLRAAPSNSDEGEGASDEGADDEVLDSDESQGPMNRKERRRENRRLRNNQRNRLIVLAPEGNFSIPKKEALSQHFLKDFSIISRIVDAIDDASPGGRCVVELGPGLGSITEPLLRKYPEMTGIELDAQVRASLAPRETIPRYSL